MSVGARSKSAVSAPFLRLAYSAPKLNEATARDVIRLTLPATKALPFVRLRAHDQPMWRPECYWCVEPTGNTKADFELGRRYARAAIVAMKADDNRQLIADIIQDIVRDSIERAGRRRGRRNPASLGFLSEVSEIVARSA
ncbi:MAG: hypothetical protein IT537_19455 [Hyphomicrobiales bacterium]|nr:hypothetical protein [Hyphomicrobiales bacterium]